jgi:hypothetical protein
MKTRKVQDQYFDFGDDWEVTKYDDSGHFLGARRFDWKFPVRITKEPLVWSQPLGQSAVDLLAWHSEPRRFLFIEVKDYRKKKVGDPQELIPELHSVVARKVRDTLAGLAMASYDAGSDMQEYSGWLAQAAMVEVYLDIRWPLPKLKAAPANPQLQALVAQKLVLAFQHSGLKARVVDNERRAEWEVREVS